MVFLNLKPSNTNARATVAYSGHPMTLKLNPLNPKTLNPKP